MVEARDRSSMKPQCYMAMIYLNWVLYLGVIAWAGLTGRYFLSFAWAALFPAFLLAYLMVFPRISRLLGYGSVEDEPAHEAEGSAGWAGVAGDAPPEGESGAAADLEVILYKAAGCPFCPIVERRLDALAEAGGVEVRKVDVTLRPRTLAAKGINAIPVVEAGGERITGNATSRQLAALIERARGPGAQAASA